MPFQSASPRVFQKWVVELAKERPGTALLHTAGGAGDAPLGKRAPSLYTHTNPAHELVYAFKGRPSIVTPTQAFTLSPGQLLLIEPNLEHAESPSEAPRPHGLFWCALDRSYADLCPTTYDPETGWRAGRDMELTGRTDVQSIATAVGHELESHNWGWEEATRALLRYLVCILVRRIRRGSIVRVLPSESPTIGLDPRAWQAIQSALQFCRANYRRSLRLAEVAAAVGYSPGYLNFLFSTHLGHSVSDHLRGLRVSTARSLLENSDISISAISRTVGYSNPAHFTRAFTRTQGLSPKAYRQRSQPT